MRGGKTVYWNGSGWQKTKPAPKNQTTKPKNNSGQQTKPAAQQNKGGQRSAPKSRRQSNPTVAKNNQSLANTAKNVAKGVIEAPGRAINNVNRNLEGLRQIRQGVAPEKVNAEARPIGSGRKSDNKLWAGQSMGYQSPESFARLKKEGRFRAGDIAIGRLGNDLVQGIDPRIRKGAGDAAMDAAIAAYEAYEKAPEPVKKGLNTVGKGLEFADARLEDVSRLTNTSRFITDELATAGLAKGIGKARQGLKAGTKAAQNAAYRQMVKIGQEISAPRPGQTVRPYRPAPQQIQAPRRPGTIKASGPQRTATKFNYANNPRVGAALPQGRNRNVGAAGRPTPRGQMTAGDQYDVVTGPRIAGGEAAAQDRMRVSRRAGAANTVDRAGVERGPRGPRRRQPLVLSQQRERRPNHFANDAVRGPALRRNDGARRQSIMSRALDGERIRVADAGQPNTVTRRGAARGPDNATRARQQLEAQAARRPSETVQMLMARNGLHPERDYDAVAALIDGGEAPIRAIQNVLRGNTPVPRVTRRGPAMTNTGRMRSPRTSVRIDPDAILDGETFDLARTAGYPSTGRSRVRAGNDNTRRRQQRSRLEQQEFERRRARALPQIAQNQSMIAGRNRVAGGGTQTRVDNFRRRNPTTGEQQLAAISAQRGVVSESTGQTRTGRIQERRRAAADRYNRDNDEVGLRNSGIRRLAGDHFDSPDNPTIRAPRGDAPRMRDGRRIRRGQLKGAKAEVARQKKEIAKKKLREGVKSAASRQGTKTKPEVVSSTDLTKRGPINPETGKRERLFTPENRAKALRKKGSVVRKGEDYDSEIGSYLGEHDRYTVAGGKVTVGSRAEYGELDMSFKSIDDRKMYYSDDELKKNGFNVRAKSGVDKKLNMANVANQQGAIMSEAKIGETITATPVDKRRALLYKRATNGALDFKEIYPGHFVVETKRIGTNTWKTINGKGVEFNPKTLSRRINELADKDTNRRLLGRRLKEKKGGGRAGGSRAQLKVRRNG